MNRHILTVSILTTLLTLAVASQPVVPVYGTNVPDQDLKCYLPIVSIVNIPPVEVTDKFTIETVVPDGPAWVCGSAVKIPPGKTSDLVGPLHWIAYNIQINFDPPPIVLIDQFGQRKVDAAAGDGFLLVPALKGLEGALNSIHFKCYPMEDPTDPPVISLKDQFGLETLDPGNADQFCTPALKKHLGIVSGDLTGPDLIRYPLPDGTTHLPAILIDQFIPLGITGVILGPQQFFYSLASQKSPFVGGEILSVDTTSLLVAGIFANAYWTIPLIAAIAGVLAFAVRARKTK